MNDLSSILKKLLTPGTAASSLTYALLGIVLATLLLVIGFWKTLFIAAFAAAGAFLGGVGNKKDALRDAVNRRFPSRDVPLKESARDRSILEKIEKASDTQE